MKVEIDISMYSTDELMDMWSLSKASTLGVLLDSTGKQNTKSFLKIIDAISDSLYNEIIFRDPKKQKELDEISEKMTELAKNQEKEFKQIGKKISKDVDNIQEKEKQKNVN